jgi:adenosylcobinamide-GDP ribazoletransferase
VAAHTAGRSAALVTMTAPAAKGEGLGADMTAGLPRRSLVVGVIAGVAITAAAIGWWAGPVLAAVAVGAAVVVWLAIRKIGGVSGDVFGTVEQVGECLALVVVSGLAAHHQLWWR